jgi:hypothetical protein
MKNIDSPIEKANKRDFNDEEITGFLRFLLEGGADAECSNTFLMIDQLKRERDYWRKATAYLASCHAATAEYDGGLKSTSKSRLDRLKAICATAALMLKQQWHPRYDADGKTDIARERCEKAARL